MRTNHLVCILAWGMAAGAVEAAPADGFVRADGAGLVRDGVPFRAAGFNKPDLFSALLTDGAEGREASIAAIDDAAQSGVRFLRFWASAFWPKDMKLYFEDPAAYWALMDDVFARARERGVMLVPSVFWLKFLWSDLCDEPLGAIVDPKSKTYAAMRTFATELVSRYKDDANVLMWELGNEYFLAADLNAGDRPTAHGAGARHLGTRPVRTIEDSLTTAMLRSFYSSMAAHIRSNAPNHLITGGDAGPRPTSVSLREKFPKAVWTEDSLRDHLASLLAANPAPLDVISIHHYGNTEGSFPPGEKPAHIGGFSVRGPEFLTAMARAAFAARTPLFAGEIGQRNPVLRDEPDGIALRAMIDLLEAEGADLIAIWVWHFPQHEIDHVTGSSHPAVLDRIRRFNDRRAAGPSK